MYGLLRYENILPIYNYLKIWNLGCKKIAFKVVQIKSLAMHITNQKLSFYIFTIENLQKSSSSWNIIFS